MSAATPRSGLAGADPLLLALVRHGESTWIAEGRFQGHGDPPLSETGRRQARLVAQRLASPSAPPALPLPGHAPIAIFHSPLARAAETARVIHDARGRDAGLVALPELMELSQGAWEGLTHDEVRRRFPAELAAWRRDPARHHAPGGESLAHAAERARSAAERIVGPDRLAAGSAPSTPHGPEPAEPVLGYERRYGSVDREPETAWAVVVAHDGILRLLILGLLGIGLERFWSFPFGLGAVTIIDVSDGLARLRAHNVDAHIGIAHG